MNQKSLRPIQFHQLCAIARTVLTQQPSMDDSDWKDRTKSVLSKQGYDYPEPDMMSRALVQVECALKQTIGPRPTRDIPLPPAPSRPQQDDPAWNSRSNRPLGWAVVERMARSLSAGSSISSQSAPAARETLAISEAAALDLFYAEIGKPEADRLSVLRVFAEIAIERPAGWSPEDIRAAAGGHSLSAESCFVCRSGRALQWHHVIQIQFGGSNAARNRAAICEPCHGAIHPWLGEKSRRQPGWESLGSVAPRALAKPAEKQAGAA